MVKYGHAPDMGEHHKNPPEWRVFLLPEIPRKNLKGKITMTSDDFVRVKIKSLCDEMIAYILAVQQRIEAIEEKYSPNQPRVPRGNPDGGQWTEGAGGGGSGGDSPSDSGTSRTSPPRYSCHGTFIDESFHSSCPWPDRNTRWRFSRMAQ